MYAPRKLVISLLLLTLLFTENCNKKKPLPPPQAQAPTIAEVLPEEIPEKTEVPMESPPTPKDTPQPKKTQKKPAKATSKRSTPPATTTVVATPPPTPAPAQSSPPQSTQTVASLRPPHTPAPEPAPEMTVAAAIPSDQANRQRENTTRMIDATENTLKSITRPLNDEEKGMRMQIETYLQQSRKATVEGDYERAFNLAKKAQVLAEALIKP